MKIDPYLHFNGNCAEAIALYEKAFNAKASHIMKYSETPAKEGYIPPPGTENWLGHATLPIGDTGLMLCDVPEMGCNFGNGVSLHVTMDNIDSAKAAFEILKEGGEVGMELQKTFWSECFGSLIDKFGVGWMLSV